MTHRIIHFPPKDTPISLRRFIVRNSFRGTRKARYCRRKERGFDRSSCSLHPRRVNAPATIAAHAPTWPASTSVDTSCRKPHLRGYTNGEEVYRYTRRRRAEQDPRGSRSPIADRTRWNLTRSARARHKNQSAFKPRRGKTSRRNESGIVQRTRQWCSSMSSGMIPRSLKGDNCGYNMQSRLCADLHW